MEPATWRHPCEDKGAMEWITPQGHLPPSKTTLMLHVRHIVVESKHSPSPPGHRIPSKIVRWILQPIFPVTFTSFLFSLRLIYRSLGVASEPFQECPPHFREMPNGECQIPGRSRESFSAQVTWYLSWTVLRGYLSLSDAPVGTVSHQSHGEITGTKGTPFCQLVTLTTPILWHVG